MTNRLIKIVIAYAFLFSETLLAQDYAIIANLNLAPVSITKSELKNIMFGNKTSFSGSSAEPCLLGSKDGNAFFETILGVSKIQFNQEWVKKELTGAGRAPKVRETAEEVIACVAAAKGGIGFIPAPAASKADGKVKVLTLND